MLEGSLTETDTLNTGCKEVKQSDFNIVQDAAYKIRNELREHTGRLREINRALIRIMPASCEEVDCPKPSEPQNFIERMTQTQESTFEVLRDMRVLLENIERELPTK